MLDSDILKELVCYRCFCRISMTASFCENSKELCVRSWDCEKSSKQQYSKLKSQIVQKHRFTTKEGFFKCSGGKETFVNRLQSTTTVQPLRNTNGGWILWRVIARVKTGIRNSFPLVLPQFKSAKALRAWIAFRSKQVLRHRKLKASQDEIISGIEGNEFRNHLSTFEVTASRNSTSIQLPQFRFRFLHCTLWCLQTTRLLI